MLKIAVLGSGRVAKKHFKALAYAKKRGLADLVAVASPRGEGARSCLDAFPNLQGCPFYTGAEELLAHTKPEILAITTPSGRHALDAKLGLEAGAHLLVEKPLAMTAKEAKAISDLAEAQGKKLAVGHIYRYFPPVPELLADIRAGVFGAPRYGALVVRWGHDQAYYDASPWRGTLTHDGGALLNQSVHALDLMRAFLGESPILSIEAKAATVAHKMEADDLAFGIFHFQNGSFASLEASTCSRPERQEASFFISYEEADIRISIDRKKPKVSVLTKGGKDLALSYVKRSAKTLLKEQGLMGLSQVLNPHTGIYLDLFKAILEDRAPRADGPSGYLAVDLVEQMLKKAGPLWGPDARLKEDLL